MLFSVMLQEFMRDGKFLLLISESISTKFLFIIYPLPSPITRSVNESFWIFWFRRISCPWPLLQTPELCPGRCPGPAAMTCYYWSFLIIYWSHNNYHTFLIVFTLNGHGNIFPSIFMHKFIDIYTNKARLYGYSLESHLTLCAMLHVSNPVP